MPVDVPFVRTLGPIDVDRERLQVAQVVRHTIREEALCLAEQLQGCRELSLVALCDGPLCGGCLSHERCLPLAKYWRQSTPFQGDSKGAPQRQVLTLCG